MWQAECEAPAQPNAQQGVAIRILPLSGRRHDTAVRQEARPVRASHIPRFNMVVHVEKKVATGPFHATATS